MEPFPNWVSCFPVSLSHGDQFTRCRGKGRPCGNLNIDAHKETNATPRKFCRQQLEWDTPLLSMRLVLQAPCV